MNQNMLKIDLAGLFYGMDLQYFLLLTICSAFFNAHICVSVLSNAMRVFRNLYNFFFLHLELTTKHVCAIFCKYKPHLHRVLPMA